eukprot:SAG22_NODE_811_length_7061_cov_84.983338_4_plen_94_part_00
MRARDSERAAAKTDAYCSAVEQLRHDFVDAAGLSEVHFGSMLQKSEALDSWHRPFDVKGTMLAGGLAGFVAYVHGAGPLEIPSKAALPRVDRC